MGMIHHLLQVLADDATWRIFSPKSRVFKKYEQIMRIWLVKKHEEKEVRKSQMKGDKNEKPKQWIDRSKQIIGFLKWWNSRRSCFFSKRWEIRSSCQCFLHTGSWSRPHKKERNRDRKWERGDFRYRIAPLRKRERGLDEAERERDLVDRKKIMTLLSPPSNSS